MSSAAPVGRSSAGRPACQSMRGRSGADAPSPQSGGRAGRGAGGPRAARWQRNERKAAALAVRDKPRLALGARIAPRPQCHRLQHQFGDIGDGRARADHAFQHHRAVRTGDGDALGAGGAGMLHAHVGDAPLAGHIGQRRAASAAAAARTHAGPLHLDPLEAERVEQPARRFDLAIVAAEIAGVVIGDCSGRCAREATGGRLSTSSSSSAVWWTTV